MKKTSVKIIRTDKDSDLPLPQYATELSSGLDLLANVSAPTVIKRFSRALIPTGIAIAIPEGLEAQVRSRSGLATKNGVFALNSPGTIDADYRGEVKVILCNLGEEDFVVERGMKIAQMVFAPVAQIAWEETNTLDATTRGEGGFGSTGVKGVKK